MGSPKGQKWPQNGGPPPPQPQIPPILTCTIGVSIVYRGPGGQLGGGGQLRQPPISTYGVVMGLMGGGGGGFGAIRPYK